MAADPNPCNYTYTEAAGILKNLGFVTSKKSGSSHKVWRLKMPTGNVVVIGLVNKGSGTMKKEYILQMIQTLGLNSLMPPEVV